MSPWQNTLKKLEITFIREFKTFFANKKMSTVTNGTSCPQEAFLFSNRLSQLLLAKTLNKILQLRDVATRSALGGTYLRIIN